MTKRAWVSCLWSHGFLSISRALSWAWASALCNAVPWSGGLPPAHSCGTSLPKAPREGNPKLSSFPQEEEKDTRPSLILTQKSPFNLHVNILLAFSRGINHSNNRNNDASSRTLTRATCRSPHHMPYTHSSTGRSQQPFGSGFLLLSLYRGRNQGSEWLSNLPKVTQLWSLGFGIPISGQSETGFQAPALSSKPEALICCVAFQQFDGYYPRTQVYSSEYL